ncbi:MAG TPA: 3TM-type holin [Candidatus Competibacteraceae bacterium]|nr:3TM-type holin [Candidatus Competibacteraceae bacterium]
MADFSGLGAVADLVGGVINRLWPDATETDKQKLALALAELDAAAKAQQAQLAVNQAEATNTSLFVAGWRPALGWVIAAILAYSYIVYPLLTFGVAMAHWEITVPRLGLDDTLWQLILGMLGLTTARAVEKIKGVVR